MTRRRWVYIDGIAVEDGEVQPRNHNRVHGDLHYTDMRTTEGVDISTRTKHREYMKRTGLTTADDYTQTWADAKQKRDAYYTSGKGGAVKREHIERAIHDLQRRK